MRKPALMLIGIAVALLLVIGLLYFGPKYGTSAKAERAIARYNAALSDALREVDPNLLAGYAHDNEIGRVTTYFTELNGRGVYMEAELLELTVVNVASQSPTVTADTVERWRYIERNRETGQTYGQAVEEEQRLTYTLIPRDGDLVVYLSLLQDDKPAGAKP